MGHTCHWTGCTTPVPPKLWGCKAHWYKLPKQLRDAIWQEYRPGQEIDKKPSVRYLAVAGMVQMWIAGDLEIRKDGSVHLTEQGQARAAAPTPRERSADAA